jgi:hypothetical protein
MKGYELIINGYYVINVIALTICKMWLYKIDFICKNLGHLTRMTI